MKLRRLLATIVVCLPLIACHRDGAPIQDNASMNPIPLRTVCIVATFANLAGHMSTLRRGEHDLGPVKGQEYLIRGEDKGIRSYEFTWESPGKENSIEFPAMSIVLSTTHDTVDGKIEDAAFKTDEDALKFWDLILAGFRIRPGAVDSSRVAATGRD